MLLNFYALYKKDKYIEHPVLGEISCAGYLNAFKKCSELLAGNSALNVQCYGLFNLSLNCYKLDTEQELTDWIDKQLDERRRLTQFLKENDSTLLQNQKQHMMYDIFVQSDQMNAGQSQHSEETKMKEFYQKEFKNNIKYFTDNKNPPTQ